MKKGEGEEEGEQKGPDELVLPYLKTLSVVHPADNNNDNNTMIQALLINGREEYPCDITRATRSLVSLVKSKDYFSSQQITKVTDDMTMFDIVLTVQAECRQYHLESDSKEHVSHLVTDVFPQVKDSILSTFKAQEQEQLTPQTSEKKLRANKEIAKIESEKKIVEISNELLEGGMPCTRIPFYK